MQPRAYDRSMTTAEQTIPQILNDLKDAKWTDAAIGLELGVTGQTIWRWRHETSPHGAVAQKPKLVRAALAGLLGRDHE